MHAQHVRMLALNVAGGIAVLGSYAWGLTGFPERSGEVWGGVPEALRPLYTVSMLTAAAGYFLFGHYLLFRVDPARARVGPGGGFGRVNALYALILFPSALWMPLTFRMLEAPGEGLWLAIRLVLALVAVGSLGLWLTLWQLRPREGGVAFWLAVVGLTAFCFQTAVLDALVWTALFPA